MAVHLVKFFFFKNNFQDQNMTLLLVCSCNKGNIFLVIAYAYSLFFDSLQQQDPPIQGCKPRDVESKKKKKKFLNILLCIVGAKISIYFSIIIYFFFFLHNHFSKRSIHQIIYFTSFNFFLLLSQIMSLSLYMDKKKVLCEILSWKLEPQDP